MYLELIPRARLQDLMGRRGRPANLDGKVALFSLGRYALREAVKILMKTSQKNEVLMPAYMCGEALDPLKEEKIKLVYYAVRKDLKPDLADLRSRITDKTLVLVVVHYFGFPQSLEKIAALTKERGIFLIEDCAHALMDGKIGLKGDLAVFSLRKMLPIPDGGALLINDPRLQNQIIRENGSRKVSWQARLKYWFGMIVDLFENRLEVPVNTARRYIRRKRIKGAGVGPGGEGISTLSQSRYGGFDLFNIAQRRRENYFAMLRALRGDHWLSAVFQELDPGVAPYALPVLANEGRDQLLLKLNQQGIMAQSWPDLPKEVDPRAFPEAYFLAERMILLPVHQNLRPCQVEKMREILERIIKDKTYEE